VEGYGIQAGHEESYVHHPVFDSPEWSPLPRPALVIHAGWDKQGSSALFCCCRHWLAWRRSDTPWVSISAPNSGSSDTTISVSAEWPLNQTGCYVFRRAFSFYCLPSQVPVLVLWSVNASSIELLVRLLVQPPVPFSAMRDLDSPDRDSRHDARICGNVKGSID